MLFGMGRRRGGSPSRRPSSSGCTPPPLPLLYFERVRPLTPVPMVKSRARQRGLWYRRGCYVARVLSEVCVQLRRQWRLLQPRVADRVKGLDCRGEVQRRHDLPAALAADEDDGVLGGVHAPKVRLTALELLALLTAAHQPLLRFTMCLPALISDHCLQCPSRHACVEERSRRGQQNEDLGEYLILQIQQILRH